MAISTYEALRHSGMRPEDFRVPSRGEWEWPQDTEARKIIKPLSAEQIQRVIEAGEKVKFATFVRGDNPEYNLKDVQVFLVNYPEDHTPDASHAHQALIREVPAYYSSKGSVVTPVDVGAVKPDNLGFASFLTVGEYTWNVDFLAKGGLNTRIDDALARGITERKFRQVAAQVPEEVNILVKPRPKFEVK